MSTLILCRTKPSYNFFFKEWNLEVHKLFSTKIDITNSAKTYLMIRTAINILLYTSYQHLGLNIWTHPPPPPPSLQVATTPGDSNEFMTCEEKGYVRLYDLRVKSECMCDGCKKVSEICIAVCAFWEVFFNIIVDLVSRVLDCVCHPPQSMIRLTLVLCFKVFFFRLRPLLFSTSKI